jgi:type I restriction enzyme S subunit
MKAEWPNKLLGDLCEVTAGGTPSRSHLEYYDGGIPWVKIGDMLQDVVTRTEETISDLGLQNSSAKVLPAGTVLISIFATIGRTAVLGINAATNQAIAGVSPRSPRGITSQYLRRFLDRSVQTLSAQARGVAQLNINGKILKSLPIPVPPLAEQERIVKLLDEADELRKLRAEADRRTSALIPALFHEMFGDPLINPRGWPKRLVSSFVAELHGGRNVNPAGADEARGRYRVLKISSVTWGDFQPEESKPVQSDYQPPASHFVRIGDLLFSRANTSDLVAATSYVFDTPPNLLLPDKLWRFVWKEPRSVEPIFVWWLFQSAGIRSELGRRATGTGGSMKNISKPKVMTLDVPIPPLTLQQKFVSRALDIRTLESAQAASRARLDALFQSMLHRAFQGEL